jgi:CHAT domain-containing protein/tetratricopeptide (TPR) repeat protein
MQAPFRTLLPLLLALSACAGGGETPAAPQASGPAGRTTGNEECAWRQAGSPGAPTYEIICGAWRDASARVVGGPAVAGPAALMQAVAAGGWREELNARAVCEAPTTTRILGDVDAVAMQCRRRNGGVPHLALAASVGGRTWFADGVAPSLPAMEATIAALSGRSVPATSSADRGALLALAARGNFGTGDIQRYQNLMRVGAYNNIEENFVAAEDAFRDALALHQRLFGADNPEQVDALVHLALQISNQGRHDEADAMFVRADRLAPQAADPMLRARMDHYRAAHYVNRRDTAKATAELEQAEAAYVRAEPRVAQLAATSRRPTGTGVQARPSRGGDPRERSTLSESAVALDPNVQLAAYGLADVWRVRAMVAQRAGDCVLARDWAQRAEALQEASGIDPAGARWRARRVAARAAACESQFAVAAADAGQASRGLRDAIGEKTPTARGLLDAGAYLDATDDNAAALSRFREGAAILRARQATAASDSVFAYLDAIGESIRRQPGAAPELAREMFEAMQLLAGGNTSAFIAQAAVRLGAGNERVRDLQEASARLSELYIRRDAAQTTGATAEALGRIDQEIAGLERARGESEAAVQAALPNYSQLVASAFAPAADVIAALGRGEGLLAIALGPTHGHAVLLRGIGDGGTATAWRVTLSRREAETRVAALRRTLEPGADGQLAPFDLAAAHALYRDLLGPGARALNSVSSLTIASSGALASLPFAALVTKPSAGSNEAAWRDAAWLVRDMALAYVPSAQSFLTLRRNARASDAPNRYAGFGAFQPPPREAIRRSLPGAACVRDADAVASLGALPLSGPEVRLAGRRLNADASVRLGPAFTRNSVLQGGLDRYRIVHLAAHALLPTELACLNQPAILASAPAGGDGRGALITAEDIVGLRLNADLVVLSACNTAGPDGRNAGEAFSGLARAFFFAGTRGLIATHWAVADESTALLMLNTVLAVADGQPGPQALRAQQVQMLAEAGQGESPGRWAHPFYWAPFVFAGTAVAGR